MRIDFLLVLWIVCGLAEDSFSADEDCRFIEKNEQTFIYSCPTYTMKRGLNRDLTITCKGLATQYPQRMFSPLFPNFLDTVSFTFVNCPQPKTSFKQLLINFEVKEFVFEVRNQSVDINGNLFQGLNMVEKIILNHNKLNSLPNNIFANLPRLSSLTVTTNATELPYGVFDGLTSLNTLALIGNPFVTLNVNLFNQLKNLKRLTISFSKIKELPRLIFYNLDQLKYLSLRNNSINRIIPGHLSTLKELTDLDLSSNQLNALHSDVFQNNQRLEKIDLSFNYILKSGLPGHIMRNLLSLKEWRMNGCNFTMFPDDLFNYTPNLELLYMENNRLKAITSSTFSALKKLKMLHMPYNDVRNMSKDAFANQRELEHFDMAGNNLGIIPRELFRNTPKLRYVNFYGQTDTNDFAADLFNGLPELRTLNLGNNLLTKLNGKTPFGDSLVLENVDMSYNNIVGISGIDWSAYPNLKDVNFRFNNIENFSLPLLASKNTNFDVSRNFMKRVSVEEFEKFNRVESSNIITTVFNFTNNTFICDCHLPKFVDFIRSSMNNNVRSMKYNAIFIEPEKYYCGSPPVLHYKTLLNMNRGEFRCQDTDWCPSGCSCRISSTNRGYARIANCSNLGWTRLPSPCPGNITVLDVSHNNIRSLNRFHCPTLRFLDASYNKIQSSNWILPPYLQRLDLNNNEITWIPRFLLEFVSKNRTTLYVSGNPLTCGFPYEELRRKLSSKSRSDLPSIRCLWNSESSADCSKEETTGLEA